MVACDKGPPEPIRSEPAATTTTSKVANPDKGDKDQGQEQGGARRAPPAAAAANGDPLNGTFTLAQAVKDIKGQGPLIATIDTSKGTLQCRLYDDKAPNTVANFIGLATGKRTWRDPKTKQWVNKPAYDGTTFHRVIKGFMIQGGDANGNGSGEPGYVIPDEVWPGAVHDRAGLLCMANRGPDTNGAQFFITDAKAAHLDSGYTIFGECAPVDVVHEIAQAPTGPRDAPLSPITIKSVSISKDKPATHGKDDKGAAK
jgi:peptidyl-prolyl cis-trans isomerase A (cyclophilin A)